MKICVKAKTDEPVEVFDQLYSFLKQSGVLVDKVKPNNRKTGLPHRLAVDGQYLRVKVSGNSLELSIGRDSWASLKGIQESIDLIKKVRNRLEAISSVSMTTSYVGRNL